MLKAMNQVNQGWAMWLPGTNDGKWYSTNCLEDAIVCKKVFLNFMWTIMTFQKWIWAFTIHDVIWRKSGSTKIYSWQWSRTNF